MEILTFLSIPHISLFAGILACLVAYWYGKGVKKFRWSEYIALVLAALVPVGLQLPLYGWPLVQLFVVSMVAGFLAEYLFGLLYHQTLNKRLWTYSKYTLNGYTSYLTIPFWGAAGVFFFVLAKTIGL